MLSIQTVHWIFFEKGFWDIEGLNPFFYFFEGNCVNSRRRDPWGWRSEFFDVIYQYSV
jgi:hypothetical protein